MLFWLILLPEALELSFINAFAYFSFCCCNTMCSFTVGFPGGASGKPANAEDVRHGFWEDALAREWQPTPVFLPKESDTTEVM